MGIFRTQVLSVIARLGFSVQVRSSEEVSEESVASIFGGKYGKACSDWGYEGTDKNQWA
jgi:hypothetical protein